MSQVKVQGNASGTGALTIAAPNTNSNYTLTLPAATTTFVGTDATQTLTNKTLSTGLVMGASTITSGTAVASTSGTSIDFTGIPSWVKRITVMFTAMSTNGTSVPIVQLGVSGTPEASGYTGYVSRTIGTSVASSAFSTGFMLYTSADWTAAASFTCAVVLTNISGNSWVASGNGTVSGGNSYLAGYKDLAGTLNMVRITTAGGANTFDAGSINILYE